MGIHGIQTARIVKCILKHLIKMILTVMFLDSLASFSLLDPGINSVH